MRSEAAVLAYRLVYNLTERHRQNALGARRKNYSRDIDTPLR